MKRLKRTTQRTKRKYLERLLAGLPLSVLVSLLFISFAQADALPKLQPCFTKEIVPITMLPGDTPIVQVMGHQFRKDDQCVPFYVTFAWKNHYDFDDGYSHYSLQFTQTFPGELRYSSDKEEFTLTANPGQWQGVSKVKEFDGFGQSCVRFDAHGACEELHKFDRGQVRAQKTLGVYLASLNYAYPAVTTHGENIPVTLSASSPLFEFKNDTWTWTPSGGHITISNPGLVSFDFPDLVQAASTKGKYQVHIDYDRNNELEQGPSHDKGKLIVTLDFNPDCKGDNNSDMDPCQQINSLLDDLEFALHARDLYPEVLQGIDKEPNYDIDRWVVKRLRQKYPYMTDAKAEQMLDTASKTSPDTLDYTVHEFCDKCSAEPLCQWREEAASRHEESHVDYLKEHPEKREVLRRKPPYTDSDKQEREEAKIKSEMELRAYNTQAKYLKAIIYQELNSHQECVFGPDFYNKFQSLIQQIQE